MTRLGLFGATFLISCILHLRTRFIDLLLRSSPRTCCTGDRWMKHKALLTPMCRSCRVWGRAQKDIIVCRVLWGSTELHIEEPTEAFNWAGFKDIHLETCLKTDSHLVDQHSALATSLCKQMEYGRIPDEMRQESRSIQLNPWKLQYVRRWKDIAMSYAALQPCNDTSNY